MLLHLVPKLMQNERSTFGAVILAGGKASRLNGIPKGNLIVKNGNAIIANIIQEVQKSAIENIIISANNSAPYLSYNLPIIKDNYSDYGPLAGIESALKYYQKRVAAVLFLPCDLPHISLREIAALSDFYLQTKSPVVFAATLDHQHPLCAVVNINCLAAVNDAINNRVKKPFLVWQKLKAEVLEFADNYPFSNINTVTDLYN